MREFYCTTDENLWTKLHIYTKSIVGLCSSNVQYLFISVHLSGQFRQTNIFVYYKNSQGSAK